MVGTEIERRDENTGTVRCGKRQGFPATSRESQRRVLELGLRRGELDTELAEKLGVGVKGVAGFAPLVVRDGTPTFGQAPTILPALRKPETLES
jgi:hypothetical protein